MRINLATPYAEKDQAKALGARWDKVNKVWYIVDVADLTPFMRWIPDLVAASRDPGASVGGHAKPSQLQTAKAAAPSVTTRPAKEVASCGCDVLPWEDCIHTLAKSSN